MTLRIVTWGLFLSSMLFWSIGWAAAFHWHGTGYGQHDSDGVLGLWMLGAFFGGLWLLLVIVRLIARIWHTEKVKAHHA
jgi:hypothetical protein